MILALLAILTFLSILVYSACSRRPKKFPAGPAGFPILGYLPFLGKKPHVQFEEIQKKYGNIFSVYFGSYLVVVLNDYKAIKEGMKRDEFHGRPDLLPLLARGEGEKIGIALNDGPEWYEQRRFVFRTLRDFGFGKLSMEPIIREEVDSCMDYIKTKMDKPVPFKYLFGSFILNSLWKILTGEQNSVDDPRFKYIMETISKGIIETEMAGPCYFMPWLARIFPELSGYKRYIDSVPPVRNLMKEIIKAHQASNSEHEDGDGRDFVEVYLSEIKKTTDPTSSFYGERGMKNLTYVLMDLFTAGSDTLNATLGWSLLYLSYNPKVMKKLQNEIDQVVGKTRVADFQDRPKMHYTEATMSEVLRKASVSRGFMQTVTKDSWFEGYFLPKDTILMPNLWAPHNDKEFWGDPEEFRPERFIQPDGTFKKCEQLLAFGIGKRSCPGEALASNEFFLFITTLLQTFNFSIDPNTEPPSLEALPGIALTPQPFSLIVTERTE